MSDPDPIRQAPLLIMGDLTSPCQQELNRQNIQDSKVTVSIIIKPIKGLVSGDY